jgi:3-oxoacyl-[acyl-carrier-protein] synthase-3
VSDLTKVFSNNLYLPVITLKEGSIGVNKSQLYLENVARFGHCFSADSVINLSDYMKTVGIQKGEYFALNSSAEGLRAQVLLQAYSGK